MCRERCVPRAPPPASLALLLPAAAAAAAPETAAERGCRGLARCPQSPSALGHQSQTAMVRSCCAREATVQIEASRNGEPGKSLSQAQAGKGWPRVPESACTRALLGACAVRMHGDCRASRETGGGGESGARQQQCCTTPCSQGTQLQDGRFCCVSCAGTWYESLLCVLTKTARLRRAGAACNFERARASPERRRRAAVRYAPRDSACNRRTDAAAA